MAITTRAGKGAALTFGEMDDNFTALATLLTLLAENSKASLGYTKLGNGLILQWGTAFIAAGDTPQTVNLPIPFPNAVLFVLGSSISVASSCGAYPNNLSSVNIFGNHPTAGVAFIAIGH